MRDRVHRPNVVLARACIHKVTLSRRHSMQAARGYGLAETDQPMPNVSAYKPCMRSTLPNRSLQCFGCERQVTEALIVIASAVVVPSFPPITTSLAVGRARAAMMDYPHINLPYIFSGTFDGCASIPLPTPLSRPADLYSDRVAMLPRSLGVYPDRDTDTTRAVEYLTNRSLETRLARGRRGYLLVFTTRLHQHSDCRIQLNDIYNTHALHASMRASLTVDLFHVFTCEI